MNDSSLYILCSDSEGHDEGPAMARIVRSASPADKRRAAQAIKRDILHAVKPRSRRAFQRQPDPEARQRGLTTPRTNKDSFKGNQNQKPASAVSPQRGAQMAKAARVVALRKCSKEKGGARNNYQLLREFYDQRMPAIMKH